VFSISTGHVALASVHFQILRRRRESNKDGSFTLTCLLFLQDTWPWLLCTTKCCAGAESPTNMALLHSHVFFISAGHVALASVHYQMLRRRRESNKDGAFALTCFLFLQGTWPWLLCTTKCCTGAESLTKIALSHSRLFYFCRTRGPGFCALPNAAQTQRV
jgi:hypothetical protein